MKYPKLVRPHAARQVVDVTLHSSELSETGTATTVELKRLNCNLQNGEFTKISADKRLITLSGMALFDGDIFRQLSVISGGTLTHDGVTYEIYRAQRHYNPDGTVNYSSLELI